VRLHETFKREGDELICNVEASFSKAALGGDLQVPTLDGTASIKLPAGTQSGAIFRLKKKGMPDLHDGGRGDELILVRVRTPTKLTSRQRELMEQLSREGL
jgi:molecular chaperone DnaJ